VNGFTVKTYKFGGHTEMLSEMYKMLKAKYAHESAIVPEGEAGTVYTPAEQQQEMVYLLLSAHLKQNKPDMMASFKRIWNAYCLHARDDAGACFQQAKMDTVNHMQQIETNNNDINNKNIIDNNIIDNNITDNNITDNNINNNNTTNNEINNKKRNNQKAKRIEHEILTVLPADIDEIQILADWLLKKSILDPCCGSGMLILAYLEWLAYLLKQCSNLSALTDYISLNIYVVDINEDAIRAYRHLLKLFLQSFDLEMPTALKAFVGNSLLMTIEPMDFIVGNPPYIGEKGHLPLFEPIKQTDFGRLYYEGKMDYFYFFIYHGYTCLKEGGTLCYLTSNYFFTADGAKKLRHFLKTRFYIQNMLNFEEKTVFQSRRLHACLYAIGKVKPVSIDVYRDIRKDPVKIPYDLAFNDRGQLQFIASDTANAILAKIKNCQICDLASQYVVRQGIVSGADRSKSRSGIFVLSHQEAGEATESMQTWLRPFYKNSQIHHFNTECKADYMIYYLDEKATDDTVPAGIIEHLMPYRELLEKRREVQNGVRAWYQLTWPRSEDVFKGPKIVVPQRRDTNTFAYIEDDFYASADVYYIKMKSSESLYEGNLNSDERSIMPLDILMLVLNSSVIRFWLYLQGKRKGSQLELYATPLKAIPIFNLAPQALLKLEQLKGHAKKADTEQVNDIIRAVDHILFDLLALTDDEIIYIQESAYENHH
jgi:adenine-specific DNA-methyltransferase